MCCGCSQVLPAFAILTILMLRLVLHKLPEKELAVSSWLALGPIGTAALALLVLGHQAPTLMASLGLAQLGQLFHQAGILASLILLGFGLWWLGIAVLTTLHHAKQDLPFNLGWWGLTFPLGVYTLAILTLAQQLNLAFLYAVGYAFAAILMLLWSLVATKTAHGFYQGHLFFSPCLKTYLEQQYNRGLQSFQFKAPSGLMHVWCSRDQRRFSFGSICFLMARMKSVI